MFPRIRRHTAFVTPGRFGSAANARRHLNAPADLFMQVMRLIKAIGELGTALTHKARLAARWYRDDV